MGQPALELDDEEQKQILIVDDEQGIIKFLKKALELSGYKVLTAESADQAMAHVISEQVDILITDIKMPGGSGLDLTSLARMTEKGFPIILMSGHVDKQTMQEKGDKERVFHCLSKPFTLKDLRFTIEEALKQPGLTVTDLDEVTE